jgi:hypothetical protein
MAVMRLLQTPEHAAYLPDYRSCSNMIHFAGESHPPLVPSPVGIAQFPLA